MVAKELGSLLYMIGMVDHHDAPDAIRCHLGVRFLQHLPDTASACACHAMQRRIGPLAPVGDVVPQISCELSYLWVFCLSVHVCVCMCL